MSEYPSDWTKTTFSSVCEKILDGTHFSPKTKSGPRLYLTSKNIKEGRIDLSDISYISEEEHREIYSRCDVKKGDILFTKDGANTGNTAINPLSEEFSLLSSVALIRPDGEFCDTGYAYQWMRSHDFQALLKSRMAGNAISRLTLEKINDLPIALSPLPEQKKIAEILSGIDAIIQKQKKKIVALGHLQASLIKNITLGTKEEGSRQTTDIGECPAYWIATKLGDIAEFANGNSFKSEDWQDNGYPIIRIQNLNGGSEFNYFLGRIDEKWFVPRGSLLFAWSGQRGKSFGPFIWNGQDGVLNQHIFKVTYAQDIDRDFLFLLLKMVQLNAERDAHGFKDSFMHVKKSDIVGTSIAMPPVEVQRRLANSYTQLSLQISLDEKKLESLKNLKCSISSDLLSGRKRVTI